MKELAQNRLQWPVIAKRFVFETIAVAGRVEPLAWLTDVLGRLLPWNWKAERLAAAVSA